MTASTLLSTALNLAIWSARHRFIIESAPSDLPLAILTHYYDELSVMWSFYEAVGGETWLEASEKMLAVIDCLSDAS